MKKQSSAHRGTLKQLLAAKGMQVRWHLGTKIRGGLIHLAVEATTPSGQDRMMVATDEGLVYVDRSVADDYSRVRTLDEIGNIAKNMIRNVWVRDRQSRTKRYEG